MERLRGVFDRSLFPFSWFLSLKMSTLVWKGVLLRFLDRFCVIDE